MADAIEVPPFPPLAWDGYSWSGEARLPSWGGFQRRRGPYASADGGEPADGTVGLIVSAEDETMRPTPGQVAAFAHLMRAESAVATAVLEALVDSYPGARKVYVEAAGDDADELPEDVDAEGLRTLIGLSTVHVLETARDGAAYVGFEFGCKWDDEHGAGVMTHLGRVVAVGGADVSFLDWIAEDDAARGDEPA